jgi:hypothetical protein
LRPPARACALLPLRLRKAALALHAICFGFALALPQLYAATCRVSRVLLCGFVIITVEIDGFCDLAALMRISARYSSTETTAAQRLGGRPFAGVAVLMGIISTRL